MKNKIYTLAILLVCSVFFNHATKAAVFVESLNLKTPDSAIIWFTARKKTSGKMLGSAALRVERSTATAELITYIVDESPCYKLRGTSHVLLDAVIAWARKYGIKEIVSNTVSDVLQAAVRYYLKQRFAKNNKQQDTKTFSFRIP